MKTISFLVILSGVPGLACSTSLFAADADQEASREFDLSYGGSFIEDFSNLRGISRLDSEATQWTNRRTNFELELEYGNRISLGLDFGYNYKNNNFTTREAYLAFDLPDRWEIRLGKMKQDFGISRSSSLKNLLTPERPLAYDMLALDRGPGIELGKSLGDFHLTTAYYQAENGDNIVIDSVLGRALYEDGGKKYWHAGISLASEDYGGEIYRIRSRAETDVMDNFLRTEKITADHVHYYGIDGAWRRGRLTLLGEILNTRVKSSQEGNRNYAGGYLQSSWFLTDDEHDFRRGQLRNVKPSHQFAVELVGTYSTLDAFSLNDGFDADVRSFGVNVYFQENFKFMAVISHLDINKGDNAGENGLSVISRLQYSF